MEKLTTFGVVIARFQLPDVHNGHRGLLDYVAARHEHMLVLLGSNDVRFNPANPYPFHMRRSMLEVYYPDATILELPDSKISNEHWSSVVDEKVQSVCGEAGAVLYGSRDSFISSYTGGFTTEVVTQFPSPSGTEVRQRWQEKLIDWVRKGIACTFGEVFNNLSFRLGWLAAIQAQYAITDPTVDVAICSSDYKRVLLGRRGKYVSLRFFGGFVDMNDLSYEAAALRERAEEVLGITVGDPVYVGSGRINDKRYKHSGYGVMTTFFAMEHLGGEPVPGDDMAEGEVEWYALDKSTIERVIPEHRELFTLLLKYKEKRLSV